MLYHKKRKFKELPYLQAHRYRDGSSEGPLSIASDNRHKSWRKRQHQIENAAKRLP